MKVENKIDEFLLKLKQMNNLKKKKKKENVPEILQTLFLFFLK